MLFRSEALEIYDFRFSFVCIQVWFLQISDFTFNFVYIQVCFLLYNFMRNCVGPLNYELEKLMYTHILFT